MKTHWRRQWLALMTSLGLIFGLVAVAGLPATTAQDDGLGNLSGAPVDIHEGSCDDFLTEPAYDGGAVEVQSFSELRDSDDFNDAGLTEISNTVGVDMDGNGELADNEIIGAVDGDAEVAVAEADIDGGIAEDGNWVAVLHASPDAYETTFACGSLNDAEEDDDGNMIVMLEPVGDATTFGYSVINGDRDNIKTYLFEPGTAPETPEAAAGSGGEGTPDVAEGFPVDIHQGTCTDFTLEPAYDGGLMELTNVAAEDEQEVGDTEAEIPAEGQDLGDVYHIDNEADFTANELRDEGPHVVAVHQSEDEYGTLVACGQVLDIPEDDNTIVPLLPVGDSNWTGTALIPNEGDGEITAFLWQCEPLEQQAMATPEPTPTPEPSPTPEPTVVVEETAIVTETEVVTETVVVTEVVESTEVVTETEVVTAPTATALAEEEGQAPEEQTTVELGDEATAITTSAGGAFTVTNTADADRTFSIPDLGVEGDLPAGESLDVVIPDDVEPGTYGYQVLEGEETVLEGDLTVE